MLYRTGLVFLSLLLAGAADAQERNCSLQPPDADVRPRHYAVDLSDNPSLLAGPRTPGCPNASPACIAPGYELMAVEVMGLYTRGDYACVIYVRPKDPWGLPYRSGYLPLSILTPIPAGEIDWSGTWTAQHPAASITLSPTAGDKVHIEGLAANIEKTAGDITAPYQGDSTTCPVRIWRGGDYLLVADNPYRGAPDVTFFGFYTKQ